MSAIYGIETFLSVIRLFDPILGHSRTPIQVGHSHFVKVRSLTVVMMYDMCLAGFCPGVLTWLAIRYELDMYELVWVRVNRQPCVTHHSQRSHCTSLPNLTLLTVANQVQVIKYTCGWIQLMEHIAA